MGRWGQQLHVYTLVGAAVFALDLGTYWALMNWLGSWFLYAHFVSRTIGGAACFLLNRFVTFRRREPQGLWAEAVRFAVLYGASFVLASLLVYGLVEWAGLSPMAGKVAAEILVFLFNYTVMKYWVMRTGGR